MNYYKKIRLKSGLTQKDFAEKYELNYRSVQHWETGRIPSQAVKTLYKIIEKGL